MFNIDKQKKTSEQRNYKLIISIPVEKRGFPIQKYAICMKQRSNTGNDDVTQDVNMFQL